LEDVQGDVNCVKEDFNPKMFTAYKDVTYSTFQHPKLREILEDHFGKNAIESIFREYGAAPEEPPL